MRVLQVDAGREWRGGQNQVRLLTRELARSPGIDLKLVTKRGSELAERATAASVFVLTVPWRIGLDPRAWWFLRRFIRACRPNIVHVHDSHALALVRAALLRPTWRSPMRRWRHRQTSPRQYEDWSPPVVVAHRRVDFHVRARSNWFCANRIVAVSDAVKLVLIADGVLPRDITVIRDGVDPEEVRANARAVLDVRAQLRLASGTPLAVNVAALVPHKDQRTLIRAAAHARPIRPDLHWVIAGAGELRHTLEREIAHQQVGDRVHLVGYIPEADALIRESDVFVMSSKEEGLGSVILHALALGKPVVATAAGGIPEVLPTECLVPVGDAEALAQKVVRSLDHPSPFPLPATLTAKSMAQATLALYHSLV
ncbi:MAG: glycosyltransferase [Gemmatimonadales bacterium]